MRKPWIIAALLGIFGLAALHCDEVTLGTRGRILVEPNPINFGGVNTGSTDRITVEAILSGPADGGYRVQDLLRGVLLSPRFKSFR